MKRRIWTKGWLAARFLLPAVASAATMPTFTLREATIRADAVVVAEPLESLATPTATNGPYKYLQAPSSRQFKVTEVLKGDFKSEQVIKVDQMEFYYLFDRSWRDRGPKSRNVTRVLLYLEKHRSPGAKGPDLVPSGLRAETDAGEVLWPYQFVNPGYYELVPENNKQWEALLREAREEVKAVGAVFALREIPDAAERNRAILKWMREHEKEFSGRGFKKPDASTPGLFWGTLEFEVFRWILESGRLDDCWEALVLNRQLNYADWVPECDARPFRSPEGRKRLEGIAFDDKKPVELRTLALWQLAESLWSGSDADPQLSATEQKELLDRGLPLLRHKEASIRRAATMLIFRASRPYSYDMIQKLGTKRAEPELLKAWRAERDATVRAGMRDTIKDITGEAPR
jgi:hypothetical protein